MSGRLFEKKEEKNSSLETKESIFEWLKRISADTNDDFEVFINQKMKTNSFHPTGSALTRDNLLDIRWSAHELREKIRLNRNDSTAQQEVQVIGELIQKIERMAELQRGYLPPLAPLHNEYKMRR